jgi:hypothetical protein
VWSFVRRLWYRKLETITNPGLGDEIFGFGGIGFELLA